ncbi:secretion accessory protein EsaB/YukD [Streptococcus chenjunshii]|uniref:Secretion accessory protein EsaB/YukD n=1 Tax=Streptococcus chenjunshii TaxID=2173853 RepID=A0A372KJY3_9STRE|nr:EsaB/YukD family protein [Streptococcus chenjunshii]AXQ79782.1 secretion accessory protein EsaB/YukD [Streptococcus chenjunshii]RFU51528.1 secretion accessory protein EsaB/YukD [Streptococcus chenjunshii]RFU52234.1 secretion accessory protein EsaB/YukD [Streptococcus chenjunshii]
MMDHINVSLIWEGKVMDIRIPRKIEVVALIEELDGIFGYGKKRRKYQLRVVNKGLLLDEGKNLADFPVTTGDIVNIEEVE